MKITVKSKLLKESLDGYYVHNLCAAALAYVNDIAPTARAIWELLWRIRH